MLEFMWQMHPDEAMRGAQPQVRQNPAEETEERTSVDIDVLAKHIDKLTLVTMSMWSLLSEHTELTEKDLLERMEKVDLLDGKLDGKTKLPGVKGGLYCKRCDRHLHPRHKKCIYCGGQASQQEIA